MTEETKEHSDSEISHIFRFEFPNNLVLLCTAIVTVFSLINVNVVVDIRYELWWDIDSRKRIGSPRANFGLETASTKGLNHQIFNLHTEDQLLLFPPSI